MRTYTYVFVLLPKMFSANGLLSSLITPKNDAIKGRKPEGAGERLVDLYENKI